MNWQPKGDKKCRWPQLVCVTLLVASRPLWGQGPMANSSRECAICHVRWVSAFDKSEFQDSVANGLQTRHAGTSDMCLSCHDGSVVDSRFKIWSTRNHTTGARPPSLMQIPTDIFPLDEEGHMTCATCHTAHAVPGSSDIRTTIFLRQPNVDSSLCLACHEEHAQKNAFQHPLGIWEEGIPQVILDAGGKSSPSGDLIICQTCHEPHGARNDWMLVLPPSQLCIACHRDKDPETMPPDHLPRHRIGESYAGFEPPASLLTERALFGPEGALDCLSCHRLHDASGAWPLLIRPNRDSALCLDCHPHTETLLGSPHDLRRTAPSALNARRETALQSGPCGACHRIHGWARDLEETSLPHGAGCVECHSPGGPGAEDYLYQAMHPMGVVRPGEKALPSTLSGAGQVITCLTCHDPHRPSPSSAEGEMPESRSQEGSASFLRVPGSDLCLLCHEDKTKMARSAHDLRSIAPGSRPDLPATGLCLNCHQVHGSLKASSTCARCHEDKQTMLGSVHDFSAGLGPGRPTFVAGGLCVNCHAIHDRHEGDLLSTLGRPAEQPMDCDACHRQGGVARDVSGPHLGKPVRYDVNGVAETFPLDSEGRVVCGTCHDIHQAEGVDKLLRRPREDSSLCLVCHRETTPLVGSLHDLRRSAPQIANRRDETAGRSGPCGSCHQIHLAPNGSDLWTLPVGGGARGLCTGCHSASGCAASAIPLRDDHPEVAFYNRTLAGVDGYTPTFDPQGHRSATGAIACPTCHDPHAGRTVSGPADTSVARDYPFLRQHAPQGLCQDCHGEEALWRFLYFHRETRHPRPERPWLTPR